jgi:hypothetical protein
LRASGRRIAVDGANDRQAASVPNSTKPVILFLLILIVPLRTG